MSVVNISRRRFLKQSGLVAGGLVVGFTLPGCAPSLLPIDTMEGGFVPNAFLQLTSDNVLRFYCPRDEMGQGITTGLGTLIAEELDVAPSALKIEFAGVHADYNNPNFGIQGTGGSTSLRAHYQQLRQVAADTRAIILEAAAQDLSVSLTSLTTFEGHVIAGNDRYPYGQFVGTAAKLELQGPATLKADSEFRYIGKEMPRLDGLAKSTGTAIYGIDVDIPGMHHAVVRRSPVPGAKLVSVDKSVAAGMPGVTAVVAISSGVAVVAENYWQAKTAATALSPKWEKLPKSNLTSDQVLADFRQAMTEADPIIDEDEGDVTEGLSVSDRVIENEYFAPYLAHAPMEPMNAVLKIENGQADLWSGTQGPVGAQGLVARFAGLETEDVRVHSTYLGGGFGRRMTLTHIIEVTEIAVATGKPIHLLWSREDDLQHGVYRPASLMKIRAGVDKDGLITGWDAKRVGGNITPDTVKNNLPALMPGLGDGSVDFIVDVAKDVFSGWLVDHSSIEGLHGDYDMANVRIGHATVDHDVPLTIWRSVGHSYTAFAVETMMDELSEEAGLDPIEFRLRNAQKNQRFNNVIKIAGEKMRGMKPGPGHFLGFASHHSFLTDVAEIAEVSVDNNQIKVHKVVCVVDCGLAVNPDIVRAQMEGSIMFGLTAALYGKLDLKEGAVQQSNFHDYPILRMNEAPEVEVVVVSSGGEPTGVGEPGLPPIAPAVANAVYAATGKRLRTLPLQLS